MRAEEGGQRRGVIDDKGEGGMRASKVSSSESESNKWRKSERWQKKHLVVPVRCVMNNKRAEGG